MKKADEAVLFPIQSMDRKGEVRNLEAHQEVKWCARRDSNSRPSGSYQNIAKSECLFWYRLRAELAGIVHLQVLDGVPGALWFCLADQSGARHVSPYFARPVLLRNAPS
jgi:hypothetical protein